MDALTKQLENLSLNLIVSSRKKKTAKKFSYKTKDDTFNWRCNNGKFQNCPGTSDMRQMAPAQPDTKPQCQKNVPAEVSAILPSYSASKQLCSRNRVDPYDSYDISKDLNFELHDDFQVTEKNDLFLVYDEKYNDEDRMLIFSTHKNLQILCENRYWLCDETFDAAPAVFKQLFTLHNIKNGKNLPLVYALFSNKQESTYTKFFRFISERVTLSPLSVSCDYELAIINAIEEVYPDSEIAGCFFHLKKSIWRHIQENNLAAKYCDLT
ncbi:hypothetical protein BpHYR1_016466 [Brachionus plicatilis]|uniref:MULE transposase domain-containing protein n=1 Tax=Brachionus plicatilis TaxID=10195 RepID=A0A3M7PN84_BRAPC|nr:hypothetical protein BpHYR1_016466 [Brachionus plicatilis]